MSIINTTYFIRQISIPKTVSGIQTLLADYIETNERKYLYLALGYKLANEFLNGLIVGENETVDQKWLDLRDGKEYTFEKDGKTFTVKWNGLKNTEKISFLANFAYCNFLTENYDSLGFGSALSTPDSENSVRVNPKAKFVSVYNFGLDLYGAPPRYEDISSEIGTIIASNAQMNFNHYWYLEPSLFNFIYFANLAAPGTYPDWIFSALNRKNIIF